MKVSRPSHRSDGRLVRPGAGRWRPASPASAPGYWALLAASVGGLVATVHFASGGTVFPVARWFQSRSPLPHFAPDRFGVAILWLQNDPSNDARDVLLHEFRTLKGVDVRPASRLIPVDAAHLVDSIDAGHARARALLKQMRASVVLWGEVLRVGNENALQLFITHSDACSLPGEGRYAFRDGLRVPQRLWGDITSIFALIACSESTTLSRAPDSAAERLRLIARVRPLLDNSAMDPNTRRALLYITATSLMEIPVGDGSDTAHLLEARALMLKVATDQHRRTRPDQWLYAQHNLGMIECNLAHCEDTSGWSYETAIGRYRAAIPVAASLGNHLMSAVLQDNLGVAMSLFAHQRRDVRLAADAIRTLTAARDSYNKLGRSDYAISVRTTAANSRGRLAEITASNHEMAKAARELRDLATPEVRARYPRMWAIAQLNLTSTLATLGLQAPPMRPSLPSSDRIQYLSESIAASRTLLTTISTTDDLWFSTQRNLGRACFGLGELTHDTALLDESIAAFDHSLTRLRKEVWPQTWLSTQREHVSALWLFGRLWNDSRPIDQSIAILREMLTVERDAPKQRALSTQIREAIRLRGRLASGCPESPARDRLHLDGSNRLP